MFGSFVLLKIDCYEKKKILIRTFLNKRIYQDKMHKLIIIFNELFMLKINKKKRAFLKNIFMLEQSQIRLTLFYFN